jgi:hypothetical protein
MEKNSDLESGMEKIRIRDKNPGFVTLILIRNTGASITINMYWLMFIFQLAQEAYACEEKEEKLVTDAVKHLTEANYQIKDLYDQFTVKVSHEYLMANYQIKDLYDQFTVKVNHISLEF